MSGNAPNLLPRRLAIGTAQFGLAYGVTNTTGKVPLAEVKRILAKAGKCGIATIDTATAYGDAEAVLGQTHGLGGFQLITKVAGLPGAEITLSDAALVVACVQQSLQRLAVPRLDAVLCHDPRDLQKPGADLLWQALEGLKQTGLIKRIGFSAYGADEIAEISTRYPVDLVQIPINVLDQRLMQEGTLDVLRERNVSVHVRSAFLQGLLLSDRPVPQHLAGLVPYLNRWDAFCRRHGISKQSGALAFLLRDARVERVVVGVESESQLDALIVAASAAIPDLDWSSLACNNPDLIDPRKWPKP
jgi:aryl-alcohol dehydrogenase-like predicted oxidoreductase